ncbi:acetyl-CoA-benzylalcohol acetyltransferase-like [Lycium barbarum]|uniref:acetyl-CoA-benzylalcohol acetyltransferase-like n=1 Tax=Lycium barbarum TaxID=112863 RepID=UPI00293E8AAF|nr:acetyl-CoA-benzylalcohol acetyltransferase-like [Lycium barbarum]
MAKLEIQIQTRKMMKPSTPTPNHLQSLSLSFFDQGAPRIYVPILFHYLPSSEWNNEGITERCDKLQKSLAETLTNFYPLAGRFREDEFSIHCNDEGVEYVESKINTDLTEFLREGPKIEPLEDLLPKMDKLSSPLLGVQVNIFNCGGLVIAIQISHVAADAFTLATFLNEWAQASLTGTTTKYCLPRFSHLSSLFPTRVLSGPQFSPPSNIGPKIVTKRFVFDALAISKLKDRINSSATFTRPTRVVAVMSLIWKVLVGISSAKHGHSRDSCFLFPINLRGKSNLPSLEHALGNFYVTVVATLEANQLRKELNDFVNSIGSTARDTSLSIGKASVDEIISLSINCGTEIINKFGQGDKMDIYACTSWCRFPWYEVDFGWGKPIWVSSVGRPFEIISLFDTKSGDGIEAWVSLKENDMAEFERDPDILSSTSKEAFDSSIWIK